LRNSVTRRSQRRAAFSVLGVPSAYPGSVVGPDTAGRRDVGDVVERNRTQVASSRDALFQANHRNEGSTSSNERTSVDTDIYEVISPENEQPGCQAVGWCCQCRRPQLPAMRLQARVRSARQG
jgi:hypothetical protein